MSEAYKGGKAPNADNAELELKIINESHNYSSLIDKLVLNSWLCP